jgi:hypothetical protein
VKIIYYALPRRSGLSLLGRGGLFAASSAASASAEHNANPKPFVWTKTAEVILAKLDRLPVSSVCV